MKSSKSGKKTDDLGLVLGIVVLLSLVLAKDYMAKSNKDGNINNVKETVRDTINSDTTFIKLSKNLIIDLNHQSGRSR